MTANMSHMDAAIACVQEDFKLFQLALRFRNAHCDEFS